MRLLILFLLLLMPTFSFAEDDRLTLLKSQYNDAVERAVTPIKRKYTTELEKLLELYTNMGDLENALIVKEELAKLKPAAIENFTEKTIVDTQWKGMGAQGREIIMEFKRDNSMIVYVNKVGDDFTRDSIERKWFIDNAERRSIQIIWYSGDIIRYQFDKEFQTLSEENSSRKYTKEK